MFFPSSKSTRSSLADQLPAAASKSKLQYLPVAVSGLVGIALGRSGLVGVGRKQPEHVSASASPALLEAHVAEPVRPAAPCQPDTVNQTAQRIHRAANQSAHHSLFDQSRFRWRAKYPHMVNRLEQHQLAQLTSFQFPRHPWRKPHTTLHQSHRKILVEVRRRTRPIAISINLASVDRNLLFDSLVPTRTAGPSPLNGLTKHHRISPRQHLTKIVL